MLNWVQIGEVVLTYGPAVAKKAFSLILAFMNDPDLLKQGQALRSGTLTTAQEVAAFQQLAKDVVADFAAANAPGAPKEAG